MRRNVWLLAIILMGLLLAVNNTVYYFTTKKSLEDSLRHELDSVAKQIEISIEFSRRGAEKYQEQIGRELRAAAVAAQYALPPDVEKVSNEQLSELKRKLDLQDITLLKRTSDNIVLYKSSDPAEIGIGTKTWKPWYEAFNQLLDLNQVTIDWGQSLDHFWSGPFEFATSDTSKINKWGYYNDGSTNYIIDPYVSYNDRQRAYDEATGVSRLIARTLSDNGTLLEIAIINPRTFPFGSRTTTTPSGQTLRHMTQEPIISGSYGFKHPEDKASVKLASDTNKTVWLNADINGKHVLKMYIPVSIDKSANMLDENGEPIDRYVLTLVADYKTIQDKLDKQIVSVVIIVAAVTLLSFLVLYTSVAAYRKSRDKLVGKTQETYVEEINQLFQSVRAQRHDFLNHVHTIQSLAEFGRIEELKAYTSELTGDIKQMNDMINIGNPAIAALIRSKVSQAELMKIHMDITFNDMNNLKLGVKSLDLTKVLGNLIDNAIDEVSLLPEEKRIVTVSGCQHSGVLEFKVSNSCSDIEALRNKPLFDAGYSSKDKTHSGLGLSIVKSIVGRYKGTVRMELTEPDIVTFVVRIPH